MSKNKTVQILLDGKEPSFDIGKLSAAVELLNQISLRESKRHLMDSTPGLTDMLDEVIDIMTNFLDWEPSDADLTGEPPITAAEMHSASWKQHQELHK